VWGSQQEVVGLKGCGKGLTTALDGDIAFGLGGKKNEGSNAHRVKETGGQGKTSADPKNY